MTCPAISITNTELPFTFESVNLYYLSKKKSVKGPKNILGTDLDDFESNEPRFDMISQWAIDCILQKTGGEANVFIEDYSFGSKGKVFHIAENTGLLKHKLWQAHLPIFPVPPTVIKQFGHGKGNAKKDQMYEAFVKKSGVSNLMQVYQPKAATVGSPVGDLVDSYFICWYGYEQMINM